MRCGKCPWKVCVIYNNVKHFTEFNVNYNNYLSCEQIVTKIKLIIKRSKKGLSHVSKILKLKKMYYLYSQIIDLKMK